MSLAIKYIGSLKAEKRKKDDGREGGRERKGGLGAWEHSPAGRRPKRQAQGLTKTLRIQSQDLGGRRAGPLHI